MRVPSEHSISHVIQNIWGDSELGEEKNQFAALIIFITDWIFAERIRAK